ncbi:MAG: HNH/ENDO VII family nuclease [Erysipelotrichaceae bacterium]
MKPVVERLSIITLDGNKIKNTDRTIKESGPQWTSSHSGTSMDQHTSSVQLEYSTAMKGEVCFSDLEKDVKFEDLELAFKQMKEEREIALGRSVTIQEEFNLRDKYYKQRSNTSFEHSMGSDLEGISKFLDYCPIIGGVKQTLEGIIGTTLSGELINDLEAKNMVVMGIFSTGIDLIPLGSILKSCNTVKSLVVSVTKDIVTSEAIGYTNSFMASCGAPPSTLIIMNLLATSVFTHYNKVSTIKDLDVTPPKVNSTNIDYIDDAFSGKHKPIIDYKYDVDPIEKVGTNEIDIKSNNDKQNVDIKDSFLSTKGVSGAKPPKVSNNIKPSRVSYERPSGYRKGVRDKVWESAKNVDGEVIDPVTRKVMNADEPWDMGHKAGFEFKKHQQSAQDRGISRKAFLNEHNIPEHYRPELPSSNRSHIGEDVTRNYFGD